MPCLRLVSPLLSSSFCPSIGGRGHPHIRTALMLCGEGRWCISWRAWGPVLTLWGLRFWGAVGGWPVRRLSLGWSYGWKGWYIGTVLGDGQGHSGGASGSDPGARRCHKPRWGPPVQRPPCGVFRNFLRYHLSASQSGGRCCVRGGSLLVGWVVGGQRWDPSGPGEVAPGPWMERREARLGGSSWGCPWACWVWAGRW